MIRISSFLGRKEEFGFWGIPLFEVIKLVGEGRKEGSIIVAQGGRGERCHQ